jgi:cobalt/nickel transport system permease protein
VNVAPDWLLQRELSLCPCGCIGTRRRGSYVVRTLAGVSDFARRSIFSHDMAVAPGLLQRLDARVKVVSLLGLVVVAAFLRSIPALVVMELGAVVVASASRLPLRVFLARVWLFVPIFTGVVVLPATLNVVTPGTIVVPLGTWFGGPLGLTAEGLESAGLIVMRVAVSISFVVLLTLTTPWSRLVAALRALRVPSTVVLVLSMAYRYLFHLLTSVGDMYTARRARTVLADADTAMGRRFVAASAGALFGKAHALSEEVYLAMVARGYTGETRTLEPGGIGARDWAWSGGCAAAGFLVLLGEHVIG